MFNRADIIKMFSSPDGEKIYKRILDFAKKHNIDDKLDGGILVGLSGGADSCFLLAFLCEYRRRNSLNNTILAVHVNHMIRGSEADRDEAFAIDFASELGTEVKTVRVDVPKVAQNDSIGLEEAARNVRYSVFNDIISGRNDIQCIMIAHNSTDNMETVIFNILRGCGISGASGIKPMRDNIARPILCLSKEEIVFLLDSCGVPYVIDSTNSDITYSRNYIRNELLPKLKNLNGDPEEAFLRMSGNLLQDLDFIEGEAEKTLKVIDVSSLRLSFLRELHPAIRARVLSKLALKICGAQLTEKHISAIENIIHEDNFSISIPRGYDFVCERGICRLYRKNDTNILSDVIISLKKGENVIQGTNLTVFIGDYDKFSSNVYNFAIQASVSSAIIDDGLYIRFRRDGDSYRYHNMTHKLKKVFNDREIPSSERDYIPLLCDKEGIVYVPGLRVRDGAYSEHEENNTKVTFIYNNSDVTSTKLYDANLRVRHEIK